MEVEVLDLAVSGRHVGFASWPVALGQIAGARWAGRTRGPTDLRPGTGYGARTAGGDDGDIPMISDAKNYLRARDLRRPL
jgi:hypothetical protein